MSASVGPARARIAELEVDLASARVYEHGWQSWSPSTDHPVTANGHRPSSPEAQTMGYRPGVELSPTGFQGEGLLAVSCEPGLTHVFATPGTGTVPSIRARLHRSTLTVEADGPVEHHVVHRPLYDALGHWASGFAPAGATIRAAPTGWCSWYQYYADVTEADLMENLDGVGRNDLPVDVIQLDDGWQAGIGDWLRMSPRFAPEGTGGGGLGGLSRISRAIRAAGRRPGLWVAPFIVGSGSDLARRHPEWVGLPVGSGWNQQIHGLDLRHPAALPALIEVFGALAEHVDYFKLDYLFAGALSGIDLYREAMTRIREAVGESYVVGCGAPILPSIGLVDAMRVGPDIAPHYEPLVDDWSSYSQATATLSTVGRAWQHGRFWVNDPDCLIARPEMERRTEWADVVRRYGGLRCSSDRIADLDPWGLHTTRTALASVPPPVPFES
ncbi:glycoside hydrolase family 36 protein [Kribbella deserti]|uniref:Glycoside hydrolase family 36 protein n=1 Tax=Kribbella deserti TaxID=1926257 RepID=A0ABV6QQU4_9ACTN